MEVEFLPCQTAWTVRVGASRNGHLSLHSYWQEG